MLDFHYIWVRAFGNNQSFRHSGASGWSVCQPEAGTLQRASALLFLVKLKGNIYPDHRRTDAGSRVNKHALRQDKLNASQKLWVGLQAAANKSALKEELRPTVYMKICSVTLLQLPQMAENESPGDILTEQ